MPGANQAVEGEISSKSTTALVTGILSLFCCQLLGIWAIISANQAKQLIERTGMGREHESKAMIGKVLGIIGLVLLVLGIVANILLAVLGALAGAAR
jgi:hypothetical protein